MHNATRHVPCLEPRIDADESDRVSKSVSNNEPLDVPDADVLVDFRAAHELVTVVCGCGVGEVGKVVKLIVFMHALHVRARGSPGLHLTRWIWQSVAMVVCSNGMRSYEVGHGASSRHVPSYQRL